MLHGSQRLSRFGTSERLNRTPRHALGVKYRHGPYPAEAIGKSIACAPRLRPDSHRVPHSAGRPVASWNAGRTPSSARSFATRVKCTEAMLEHPMLSTAAIRDVAETSGNAIDLLEALTIPHNAKH